MFGWTGSEIPFLIALPILLIGSAFFSGSETALFGLSHTERMAIRARGTLAAHAVEALLAEPRLLLITVLLGNMVVNVLYFVISSVLLIKAADASVLERTLIGIVTLLMLVLLGEVIPKLLANASRSTFTSLTAPPLLAMHRATTPLRRLLDALVVAPLSRLTAPSTPPDSLARDELHRLLDLSIDEGVIDESEQRILADVIELSDRRVDHVMTPRVKVAALERSARREDVVALARETRLTKFPVIEGDLDHVVGILHVKSFLLDTSAATIAASPAMTEPRFIPELATLDRLLEDFRRTRTQVAIAVDEYGGTAGIIAIEDIVREIVGDLRDVRAKTTQSMQRLDQYRYRVDADTDIRDIEIVMFGETPESDPASLGGLVAAKLGRAPEVGDVVGLGRLVCEVERVSGTRVESLIVTYFPSSDGLEPEERGAPNS